MTNITLSDIIIQLYTNDIDTLSMPHEYKSLILEHNIPTLIAHIKEVHLRHSIWILFNGGNESWAIGKLIEYIAEHLESNERFMECGYKDMRSADIDCDIEDYLHRFTEIFIKMIELQD